MFHTESISVLFQLSLLHDQAKQPTPPTSDNPSPSPKLTQLLHRFVKIFQEPNTLPPQRSITYLIQLLPNFVLVNVCPYRYPYSQKAELEK